MKESQAKSTWRSLERTSLQEGPTQADIYNQEMASPWSSGVWKSSPKKIDLYSSTGPKSRRGRVEEIIKAPPRAHRLRSFGRTGSSALMSIGTSLLLGISGALVLAIIALVVI